MSQDVSLLSNKLNIGPGLGSTSQDASGNQSRFASQSKAFAKKGSSCKKSGSRCNTSMQNQRIIRYKLKVETNKMNDDLMDDSAMQNLLSG